MNKFSSPFMSKSPLKEDRKYKKFEKKVDKAIATDKEESDLTYLEDQKGRKRKKLQKKSDRKKAKARKTYDQLSNEGKKKAGDKTKDQDRKIGGLNEATLRTLKEQR